MIGRPARLVPVLLTVAMGCGAPAGNGAPAAIRNVNDRYVAAVASRDTAAIANLFAEDAVILVHNAPTVVGRDAVRRLYAGFFAAIPNPAMTLVAESIVISASEDLAYEIARYTVSGTAPGGTRWDDRGRYLIALVPGSGGWRIASIAGASELAPPGVEGGAAEVGSRGQAPE